MKIIVLTKQVKIGDTVKCDFAGIEAAVRIKEHTEADVIVYVLGEKSDGIMPVSYTHLDVYKRQVLSSMGSSCNHIAHVSTQLPYAITAAASSAVAYLFVGLTYESMGLGVAAAIGIAIAILGSWLIATVAHKMSKNKVD